MPYDADPYNRLASVREAINRVLNAQEYSVGSRRTKYAELAQLRELEAAILAEINQTPTMVRVGVRTNPA